MRISTQTLYAQSMRSMNQQQADLSHVGQQIASGQRVMRPSDDPQAASRAVQVSQAQAITSQYTDSRVSARNALSMEESVLNSVGDAVTSAKTLMLEAANGTLTDADRASIASQLQGIYQTVIGQANSTDGNGRYLFGGYQDKSAPFVTDASGNVQYVGDTNTRQQQIDASRLMSVDDNGVSVFQSAQGASGFMAVAVKSDGTANAGSVTIKGPEVVDTSDPAYGTPFKIAFAVDASGSATYTIEDTTGAVLQPPQAYTSGQPVTYGGQSLTLTGTPADGDEIKVDQAKNLNPDLFKTFEKALAILKQPVDTPAKQAALQNTLGNAMTEFDNSLDNVLMVRASVGSRLNELDVVDKVASNRQLNYAQTKSDLVDLDYNTAISEYSLRSVGLQAAQKAFVSMKQMNLFDLL
ncbi:MAG TPA: flagellar hook-associated protein FlgL [Rhodanobacteraceae bacterium]|nr:flagellar hook-associated protein FlgL [Rhodanobacteraceae bacterium]